MPFSPELTGAELFVQTEEGRENLRRIVELLASSYVSGTIQWRKEIGHPRLDDFGRAFVVTLATTQVVGQGPGLPNLQLPKDLQFDIPFSLGEDGGYYRLGFHGFMPDTPNLADLEIRHQGRAGRIRPRRIVGQREWSTIWRHASHKPAGLVPFL